MEFCNNHNSCPVLKAYAVFFQWGKIWSNHKLFKHGIRVVYHRTGHFFGDTMNTANLSSSWSYFGVYSVTGKWYIKTWTAVKCTTNLVQLNVFTVISELFLCSPSQCESVIISNHVTKIQFAEYGILTAHIIVKITLTKKHPYSFTALIEEIRLYKGVPLPLSVCSAAFLNLNCKLLNHGRKYNLDFVINSLINLGC